MGIYEEAERAREQLKEADAQLVSVALFGQPGAGKSSLINKLVGEKVAETGVETDKTVKEESYEHNGLELVDLPGYGTTKFPKEGYKEQFKLTRFDLFLCVTSGKFLAADTELFRELDAMGKVCIFVVNKHDELWEDDVPLSELEQRKRADIIKQVGKDVQIVFTSCRTNHGLAELNQAILENLAAAQRERWVRSARAYSAKFLEEKREAAEKRVVLAAGVSAANGLNPIPGADFAVDLSVLVRLFTELRDSFGLTETKVNSLKEHAVPTISVAANNVLRYAMREGILQLMKQYAGRQIAKTASKYVPFVGQAIAATAGFTITYAVGRSYLTDCYAVAKQILDEELKH